MFIIGVIGTLLIIPTALVSASGPFRRHWAGPQLERKSLKNKNLYSKFFEYCIEMFDKNN